MVKEIALVLPLLSPVADLHRPAYPCPEFQAGWAIGGSGPITSVMYDETSLLMTIIWHYNFVTVYYPVPRSVMQTFSQSSNFVQTYNSYMGSYEALLIKEVDNCPVLQENGGYIWVD
jgi:hypothetical protein